MQPDEIPSFLRELLTAAEQAGEDRSGLLSVLERFDIRQSPGPRSEAKAESDDRIRELVRLPEEMTSVSPHERYTRCPSICWFPASSTLGLKIETLFEYRTHGHHFREEPRGTRYGPLGYLKFLDLILDNLPSLKWAIQQRWPSPNESP